MAPSNPRRFFDSTLRQSEKYFQGKGNIWCSKCLKSKPKLQFSDTFVKCLKSEHTNVWISDKFGNLRNIFKEKEVFGIALLTKIIN